jgi:hypothetical protein
MRWKTQVRQEGVEPGRRRASDTRRASEKEGEWTRGGEGRGGERGE